MNKLEEIRANVEYHKQNMDDYFARYNEYPFYPDAKMEMIAALLPIVEAAIKLNPLEVFRQPSDTGLLECTDCEASWQNGKKPHHNRDCSVKKFLDALSALQQSDGVS